MSWRTACRTAVTVALACALAVPACARAAWPTIRIATEGAYPPFNYVDQAVNEPAGFEIDLGRAICSALRATCTFVVQDWDTMIDALKHDQFDAIMSSMEITDERRRRIAFSKPYYRIPSALIAARDNDQTRSSPADLAGRSIGATADSEFLSFLEDAYKTSSIRSYDKIEEAELDLQTGRIDYVLGDKLALSTFIATRDGAACCRFVADLPVDRGGGIGIGVRKTDPELLALFDKAIDQVEADGTYARIREKYFPFDIK